MTATVPIDLTTPGNRPPQVKEHSPWDAIQHVKEIAPGIVQVSTAVHGGIWVADCLLPFMSTEAKKYAERWSGSKQWFEEDYAWAYVADAFPQHFAEGVREAAAKTLEYIRRDK